MIRGLVVNRFSSDGIRITAENTGVRIEGNFIGTDPSGTIDLGNVLGVDIASGVDGTIVGGTTTAARNLISGNDFAGVFIQPATTGTKVQGNLIGTKKDGIGRLGNAGAGVSIPGTAAPAPLATGTLIGGTTVASSNTIAFNRGDGVEIDSGSTANRILANSISSNNGGVGIDLLGTPEATANDPGDKDAGPNGLQNKPTIASAITSGGKTTVKGKLSTKPNKTFMVRLFSNPTGGDEGKTFIGQKKVTTNSDGKASFTFSPAQKLGAGKTMTAHCHRLRRQHLRVLSPPGGGGCLETIG